nr:division/cell wall cluster transcriptional repressor MraZ [Tepidiphilus margaritifer]
MNDVFQGAVTLSLDAKGRIAIPTRFREALAPEGRPLVLTAHPHKCLLVYPEAVWTPIRERIVALPGLDPRTAALKRLLVGFAQEEELDTSGRVSVVASLRQWAGLEKNVWLVGQGTHFELWSEAGWQAQQEAMLALSAEDLARTFEGVVL